eukprot:CAMPEP_0181187762 /NCGR_PEP_ID=MMETSP1096-20121128/10750_1 /TAXON_ID=156174 ORGANISM="Chrysochromulina ericina, Strain CCMP281" /NCGR_SAMPLE_ID=MMETSP1096 /ASSEMBLY_ACC=CAM_ASM_000453 /LENGTH=71 /DNA_ID=CAMNT_0023276767 /DNA_START=28 /DNA_END=239 /DNA_ORIENTATION=-
MNEHDALSTRSGWELYAQAVCAGVGLGGWRATWFGSEAGQGRPQDMERGKVDRAKLALLSSIGQTRQRSSG